MLNLPPIELTINNTFILVGISLKECIASLDSAYDNPRNRKKIKRGRKRIYDDDIFQERFNTIEH